MTTPKITVTVDGAPVSGAFFNRLISLTINDSEGVTADRLSLSFNDAPPHIISPRRGAIVSVSMEHNYISVPMGTFAIDQVTYNCLPYTITVTGHSINFRAGLKTRKSKHWDDISVKNIVEEKANEMGLKAVISDKVSSYIYDWIAQNDESDIAFLDRLSTRHGALFSIKNGNILWLNKATGKNENEDPIDSGIITPDVIVTGSLSLSEQDNGQYQTVKAYWYDRKNAERREVIVDADPNADGQHVLPTPYKSEEEATSAALSAAKEIISGQVTTRCTVVGSPNLFAGQPIIYQGVRSTVDNRQYLLTNVTHSYSKSGGLVTSFSGKLKLE